MHRLIRNAGHPHEAVCRRIETLKAMRVGKPWKSRGIKREVCDIGIRQRARGRREAVDLLRRRIDTGHASTAQACPQLAIRGAQQAIGKAARQGIGAGIADRQFDRAARLQIITTNAALMPHP